MNQWIGAAFLDHDDPDFIGKIQTTEMVFFEQELRCFPMIFSLELVLGAMGC